MLAAVDSFVSAGADDTPMIVTCPHCATRYRLAEDKFPPGGRTVRCGKCSRSWLEEPDAVEPGERLVEVKSNLNVSQASEEHPRVVRPKGQELAVLIAFVGLPAVVALLVWGVVQYRDAVLRVWPQADTLYRATGISPSPKRLSL
jgi:predicted Zn finger-like uncharacterized protein